MQPFLHKRNSGRCASCRESGKGDDPFVTGSGAHCEALTKKQLDKITKRKPDRKPKSSTQATDVKRLADPQQEFTGS